MKRKRKRLNTTDDGEIEIAEADRAQAHRVLDLWLDECGTQATDDFGSGYSGYIGRIKLCAFVNDDGVWLRIERGFTRDL
jgi:hypothetical protein